jgi:hypothetical protein
LSLLREPLLHFAALGAALFALFAWQRGPIAERPERIVVEPARIEQLALGFERMWQRPPDDAELAGLIEDWVREEIFYREALALGLDRDDTIVRRRMRQKLEFLSEDLADVAEPSDADLERWLAEHAEDHRVEPRVALRQVYLSRERRGAAAEADAAALLARLRADGTADVAGDASLLPASLPPSTPREVARHFGDDFAAAVLELEPGRWAGPVESTFGLHLVLLEAREEGRMPALAEVREAVANDWRAARRAEANEAFYQSLRSRYEVVREPPPGAAP